MDIYPLSYLFPLILISISIAIKIIKPKYPPTKKIPIKSGFHSKASMQSEIHWNYAQRIAPNIMIIVSIIDVLIMTLMNILYNKNIISENTIEHSISLVGFLTMACGFLITDYKIKRL